MHILVQEYKWKSTLKDGWCLRVAFYLFVGVFVSLQCLHDGQLSVVFEARRLVSQNLFEHTQRHSPDGMLRRKCTNVSPYWLLVQAILYRPLHKLCLILCNHKYIFLYPTHECQLTSLSPRVSSSRRRMVLKCSSQTAVLSSRVIFSSSTRAPFRSSDRSLWLDSSFRRSATMSEWSWPTAREKTVLQNFNMPNIMHCGDLSDNYESVSHFQHHAVNVPSRAWTIRV